MEYLAIELFMSIMTLCFFLEGTCQKAIETTEVVEEPGQIDYSSLPWLYSTLLLLTSL